MESSDGGKKAHCTWSFDLQRLCNTVYWVSHYYHLYIYLIISLNDMQLTIFIIE